MSKPLPLHTLQEDEGVQRCFIYLTSAAEIALTCRCIVSLQNYLLKIWIDHPSLM